MPTLELLVAKGGREMIGERGTAARIFGALLGLVLIAWAALGASAHEDIQVKIEIAKSKYAIGEPFSFVLTASVDCHFLVFTIDAADNVEIHDPSASEQFMGPPLLRAGERREVPARGAPGRAIITPPEGLYEIGAVCGRDQLSTYGLDIAGMTTPAQSGRRGFKFFLEKATESIDRAALARITANFEITP